ncbi:beta strand repeat-containing protein, partial [Acinetobacter guillouiae]|uniref:beta strand repeat-containing protein n=2 Tax=Acinetobacter TaxID=469 RepID=UPI003AF4BAB0
DAGQYTNTATGIDKNYELSFVNGSLDIAKAKATVTANSVTTTYNGKDQTAAGFSAIGLVNGETESVLSGISATVTAKDAGQYTNTATGLDKNYELSFVDGSLDIAKAKATVTANSLNTVYNGKDQSAAGFSATGLVNGETESVLSGVSATVTAKDAGKYTNSATGLDKNYELSFVDGSLDIAKAKATVTANSLNTVYNGKGQTAAGFSATGLVNGETESVLSGVSATVTAKDAGKYTNTATGLDKNYELSFVDGSLDIAKAKVTVTANSVSTTYNGKDQTAAGFTATGLVNGETESVLSGVSATVTAKDAGQYTNTVTGLDKNYELMLIDGSLDIAKAKATVTANSLNTVYNGKGQTAAGFSATGLVNGETTTVLSGVSATVTAKDAGKYTNSATGIDKNYELSFIDGSLDIAKAKATVTANSLNTVYNGKVQTAAGFTATGLVNGETESVLSGVSATVTAKDAGQYTNTATGLDKNYELSFVDGSLDIAKAKATVTANSLNTVYNGKDQTAAGFSATGLVNGETESVLSGVSATVTAKDAGKYTNTATGLDKNYELSFVDGSLDIAKAKATVTANSLNTVYNGKDQTAAGFTATGLVNGETESVLSGVSATVIAKDAGKYINSATGLDKNYELSFVDGSLDIAKAKATVTANSLNTVYNGKDQTAAGFSATGLVNGETESVLSGVSATVTAKDAGKYNNKVTGVDKNYDLTLIDGSLDIAKAKATVTANSVSTTYNGKGQTAAGFTATGLVNGETESVLSGVSATVTAKDAGKYTNSATGLDKNYELSFVDGSLDIAKAKATVTANSISTTYNGKDQTAAGFSATGLVNGETESVLSGVSATVTAKDAGKYKNKVTGVDKNYDLTLIDGSLDIAKAKATVTANSVSTTYNGKDQNASGFSATGLVNGESESVLSGVTATVTAKDAGQYTNTATGLDKNYELSFVDGSLDIAKAKATVTANSVSTTYNGKDQTAAGFSATGLVNGETESVLSGVSATVTAKDAGQYTNTATGIDKNYELSFVDGSLDIAKAKATVTANSISTTYNGKDQNASGFTATGLVNGETESVLSGVTATVTAKDAGKYNNTVTGVDKNYDLTLIDGSLDIAKAKATVTANSVSTTYNGKNQTAAGFSATGLVNGETESVLSGVTATVTAKDAGKYTNTATGLDKNYELSFVDGSLDIAKAKASVTANSVSTTYNGKNQTASGFSASGLVNGETESVLSGVSATVTGKDAGKYTNTATGLDKNYELSFVDGALDIAKAKATVTANSLNTVYNGKDQTAAGFSASGLVNGETESVLSGVSATVTGKDAGKYTNSATGVDKNYELTFVDGALDIAKAKINQVTGISANNRIYDATTNATLNTGSAQFTGMVAGDELKVASATGQFSDKNVGIAKQVSIQGVSLSGADAHNYELVNNTAQTTADIRQANIQNIAGITANNRTYNGLTAAELNLSNAQFNGIYAGDNLNVATATGQFDSATTGQAKNVSITGLSLGGLDAQNYKLVDTTAVTTADIYLLTPAAYLQAIQFKRPRYLPETNNVLNTVDLDVRQGGVNTAGIQILAGEH